VAAASFPFIAAPHPYPPPTPSHRVPPRLQERRREAEAIAREAVEVHGVMRDIGGLVAAQGEALVVVEENVTKTVDTVIAANKDLTTAAAYQRSYRKKCLVFICLLLVLAAAIAVPLALHYTKK
jgi:t-SNARE complex subunit (syntaxin)